jgi:outer membrane protein TolC
MKLLLLFLFCLILASVYCKAHANSECLSLERCIHIATKDHPEINAAENLITSIRRYLDAIEKGTGYRTDLAFSVNNDNKSLQSEKLSTHEELHENNIKSTLNMKQEYLWGGSIELYAGADLARDKDNPFKDETKDYFEDNFSTGIAISKELLSKSSLEQDFEEIKLKLDRTKISYNLVKRNVIYNTTKSYYDYLKAIEIFNIYKDAYDMTEALSKYANSQYINGLSSTIDLLEVKSELSIIKASVENARINTILAKNTLLKELNHSDRNLPTCNKIEFHEIRLENKEKFESLIKKHPSIELFNKEIDLLRVEKSREETKFSSSLELKGNYLHQIFGDNSNYDYNKEYQDEWSVGAVYTIPIWDNKVNDNNIASIRSLIKKTRYDRNSKYRTLMTDFKNAVDSINHLTNVIKQLKSAVKITQSNVDLKNKKFTKGLIGIDEIIRSKQGLTNAKMKLIENIVEYNLSIADLSYLIGHPIKKS